MPIIGSGLGPGGRGNDKVDLRRVAMYTLIINPTIAVYSAKYMIEIGRLKCLVEGKRARKVFQSDFLM